MQISSRFTIAIHILTCIETFKNDYKVTSDFLAGSIHVNPVVLRRLLSQLKAAGIIEVARGTGGANAARPLKEITMLDVYRAVACVDKGELFHFPENPNPKCPVGLNIHNVLNSKLDMVQRAMEDELGRISMEEIITETRQFINREN